MSSAVEMPYRCLAPNVSDEILIELCAWLHEHGIRDEDIVAVGTDLLVAPAQEV